MDPLTDLHPTWSDSSQGDLLELVAQGSPSSPSADEEWETYQSALVEAADADGIVRPNVLRPLVRGRIAPRRISAFTSRAVARDLIVPTGEWEISDDHAGRNAGRPMRTYRLAGAA